MLKRTLMLSIALCALVATAAVAEAPLAVVPAADMPAEAPCDAPGATDAIADAPLYGMAQTALASEGRGGPDANCTASADCYNGSTVSCSGSSSCFAYDANCPSSRGYVQCDGARQYCPSCPPTDPCAYLNNSYCTYQRNKFSGCCIAVWVAPGASCPNVCD